MYQITVLVFIGGEVVFTNKRAREEEKAKILTPHQCHFSTGAMLEG